MPLKKRKATARSSTFNFARTSQNQKSFHFPTTTLTRISNILYNEIRYIKSKLLNWSFQILKQNEQNKRSTGRKGHQADLAR